MTVPADTDQDADAPVLLTGTTGNTGAALLSRLVERGANVRAWCGALPTAPGFRQG